MGSLAHCPRRLPAIAAQHCEPRRKRSKNRFAMDRGDKAEGQGEFLSEPLVWGPWCVTKREGHEGQIMYLIQIKIGLVSNESICHYYNTNSGEVV
jgi:hypothetical protein